MVQITTIFDKIDGKSQKVFKIRGDESYARRTNVRVSLADNPYTTTVSNFDVTISVTLYKGVGDSNLIIYDGEDTIGIESWASTDTTKTITISGLAYGVTHKIKVKYTGNTECLASTSNIIPIQKDNDLVRATKLVMGSSSVTGTSATLTATLTDKDSATGSNFGSKTVKFYIDGAYVGSGTTTNDGVASYTATGLTNGKKTVTAVFDGYTDTTYVLGGSTKSVRLSVGYKVAITSYPSVFINGSENIVKVKVTDYRDLVQENKTVSFNSVTATTNSNGIASITITSITGGEYYATCSGYNSDPITVVVPTVTSVTMSSDRTWVTPNMSAVISGELGGTDLQPNTPVALTGGISGTYYTDTNNRVTTSYTGTGSGDVTVTGTYGSYSGSVTIEDLLARWVASESEGYISLTNISGGKTYQTDGVKFTIPNGGICKIGFNWSGTDGSASIGDYDLTFTNVTSMKNILFHVGSWRKDSNGKAIVGGASGWESYGQVWFSEGATFRVSKRGPTVKIYKWNEEVYSYTLNSSIYPCMFFKSTESNKYVKINNIKLKKVV